MRHILFSFALSVAAVSSVGCATSGDDSTDTSTDEVTAPGTFDVWQASDGQWRFHLVAGNHRILVTSEAYTSRTGALNGALSVMDNGVDPASYRLVQATNGGWLLNLVAGNGEIIGHSEVYWSKSNAARAIGACVRAVTSYLDHKVAAAGARAQVEAGDTGKYHFNLFAQNGEIVLSSQAYETAASAWNGAFAAQSAAVSENAFAINTALDGSFYFTLRAPNGQVVGVSQMYAAFTGAALGIDSVQSVFATVDLL